MCNRYTFCLNFRPLFWCFLLFLRTDQLDSPTSTVSGGVLLRCNGTLHCSPTPERNEEARGENPPAHSLDGQRSQKDTGSSKEPLLDIHGRHAHALRPVDLQ